MPKVIELAGTAFPDARSQIFLESLISREIPLHFKKVGLKLC